MDDDTETRTEFDVAPQHDSRDWVLGPCEPCALASGWAKICRQAQCPARKKEEG